VSNMLSLRKCSGCCFNICFLARCGLSSKSRISDLQLKNQMRSSTKVMGDIAGLVYVVGENVTEFKLGNHIAAFHEMLAPGRSCAEYAVSWEYCTFHVPKNTTFESEHPKNSTQRQVYLSLHFLPQKWRPPSLQQLPLQWVFTNTSAFLFLP